MEKDNIDKVFAQKLAEHRQEPSPRALERFNERLNEREAKKKTAFLGINKTTKLYYGAAASVVIALSVISYRFYEKTQIEPKPIITFNKPQEKTSPSIANNTIVDTKSTHLLVHKHQRVFTQKTTVETPLLLTKIEPVEIENVARKDSVSFQKIETQVANNQVVIQKNEELNTVQQIVKIPDDDVVLVLSETTVSENSSPINIEKNVINSENNEPFLKRFWTELKHLKNGEKVELKLLKTKPKDVLARASESLFKDERDEARESWQRLREKVSKKNDR